jgi:hypothetical protein
VRRSRAPGSLLAAGPVLAVLGLMLLAAPALGAPVLFHGASWSAFTTKNAQGCSWGSSEKTEWSKAAGLGTLYATGHSKTCKGQPPVFGSSATISSELVVSVPEVLAHAASGMNVSWNLVATLSSTGGVLNSTPCPATRSSVNYNLGYTWENYTSISFACYGLGTVSIGGSTYVEDVTTGQEYSSNNSWSGVSNESGLENYSSADSYAYSSPSYWAYNSSSSFNQNHSFGPRGSLSGRWNPTWFINDTFIPADRYLVVTSIEVTVYAQAYGFVKSYGTGTGDLAKGPNHADLSSVNVW